jgi:3D (Asp-Asp-Asp) domain-containing protein
MRKRIAIITALAIAITIMQQPAVKAVEAPKIHTQVVVEAASQPDAGIQTAWIDLGSFTVTAYSPDERDSGQWGSQTKSGITAQAGVTIAADWSVLPEGTVVQIDGIGTRVVQDIGGKIKGRHIDIYLNTHAEAEAFGRQHLEIYIKRRDEYV